LFNFVLVTPVSIAMLDSMLKDSTYPRTGAEALSWLCAPETRQAFCVVVRLSVVVLISILISHFHAEPV